MKCQKIPVNRADTLMSRSFVDTQLKPHFSHRWSHKLDNHTTHITFVSTVRDFIRLKAERFFFRLLLESTMARAGVNDHCFDYLFQCELLTLILFYLYLSEIRSHLTVYLKISNDRSYRTTGTEQAYEWYIEHQPIKAVIASSDFKNSVGYMRTDPQSWKVNNSQH